MKSVVYNSFGVWRFYLSAGQLKMYSPIVLDEIDLIETDYGFSVCCDNKDNIYIICQNNYGDIYFIVVNGEKTEKNCMLESKIKNGYDKSFSMVNVNGWINAFYMLEHENKNIIIHHIVNSKNQPEIIETLDCKSPVFVCSKSDDLYMFYVKSKSLVYRKYKWSEKAWSEHVALCSEEDEILYINAFVNNKINAVYCTEKRGRFKAVYATDGYNYELIKNSASLLKPVVCEKENVMHILFEYGGRILESTDADKNEVISRPKYSYYGTFEKCEAVEINTPELEKIYTYGYETHKGVFRPLVLGYVKVNKITSATEARSEIEEVMQEQENKKDIYGEILKMLDNTNEMKILSEIAKKLSVLEDTISKLLNKTEGMEDGNKGQME